LSRTPDGNGVLSYLGRYIRGGPISNRRLISCEGGKVKFWYRVNGEGSGSEKRDAMTLSVGKRVSNPSFSIQ
jgi:hypothetical protein